MKHRRVSLTQRTTNEQKLSMDTRGHSGYQGMVLIRESTTRTQRRDMEFHNVDVHCILLHRILEPTQKTKENKMTSFETHGIRGVNLSGPAKQYVKCPRCSNLARTPTEAQARAALLIHLLEQKQ